MSLQGDASPVLFTAPSLPGQADPNQMFINHNGVYWGTNGTFAKIPDVNGTIAVAGTTTGTAANASSLGGIAAAQIPAWYKYSVAVNSTNLIVSSAGTALSTTALAGASTQTLNIFQLPANAFVHGARIKTTTVFAGPTGVTCTVGVTGALTKYISSAYNLFTAVSATQIADSVAVGNLTTAAVNFTVAFTVNTTNMTDVTSGAFDIWVNYAVLP